MASQLHRRDDPSARVVLHRRPGQAQIPADLPGVEDITKIVSPQASTSGALTRLDRHESFGSR